MDKPKIEFCPFCGKDREIIFDKNKKIKKCAYCGKTINLLTDTVSDNANEDERIDE